MEAFFLHILSKRKGEGPVLGARTAAFTSQLCHFLPVLGRSQHSLLRPRGVDVREGLGAPAEAHSSVMSGLSPGPSFESRPASCPHLCPQHMAGVWVITQ